MDTPQYADFGRMFEMTPMAGYMALEQAGLARQFEEQKRREAAAQAGANLETTNLSNLYSQQTLPSRVESQRLDTATKAAELEPKITTAEVSKATRPQTVDQAKREAVLRASQQEIDAIGQKAQLMAYGSDPKQREQGIKLMQLHRDFVKMREESNLKRAEEAQKTRGHSEAALELERLQQAGGKYNRASRGGFGGLTFIQSLSKMKVPERMGALEATLSTGVSPETQQPLSDIERTYFESMLAQDKATYGARTYQQGVTAGVTPEGQVKVVPKQSPSLEAGTRAAPAAQQPPKVSLADVQRMYPGIPPDKLKQAYKAKFGVDLQ